jgi:F0F1-type ATP synthase assembly protein I
LCYNSQGFVPIMNNKSDYKWIQTAGEVGSIGLIVLVSAGLGLLLGIWLDRKFGTTPYLALTMTLVGLAAGIYEAVRILIKVTHSDD